MGDYRFKQGKIILIFIVMQNYRNDQLDTKANKKRCKNNSYIPAPVGEFLRQGFKFIIHKNMTG